MRLPAAAIAATLLLASTAAYALSNTVVVKLEAPVAASKSTVIVAGVGFSCSTDICTAVMDRKTAQVRDCRQIAREVGRVTSFKVGTTELDAAGIAACNTAVKN